MQENEAYFKARGDVYLSEQSLVPARAQGKTGGGRTFCHCSALTISELFQGSPGDRLPLLPP